MTTLPTTPSQTTPKREALKAAKKRQDASSLAQFLLLGLIGTNLVVSLGLLGLYGTLAGKPVPSLVQLATGEAIRVAPQDSKAREPETIKRFVADSLILLMSWNNQLPPQRDENGSLLPPLADPGMALKLDGKDVRLTSTAYQASYAFDEAFREELVEQLAAQTPTGVFDGSAQTLLTLQAITEPEEIEPGRWTISVVGNVVSAQANTGQTTREPFNRTLIVRAIDSPPLPLNGEAATPLALAVQSVRQSGLEIESMEALTP